MRKIDSKTKEIYDALQRGGAEYEHKQMSAKMLQQRTISYLSEKQIRKQLKLLREKGYIDIQREPYNPYNQIKIVKKLDYKEEPEQMWFSDLKEEEQ